MKSIQCANMLLCLDKKKIDVLLGLKFGFFQELLMTLYFGVCFI